MMKKRIILILSTITILIGSSYYVSGNLIKQSYVQVIAKLANHQDVKVSLLSYSQGLFHSQAKLQLSLANQGNETSAPIIIEQNIAHGPIIAVSTPAGLKIKLIAGKISTQLEEEQQKLLIQYTGNKNPFYLTTIIEFNNNATTWLNVAGTDQSAANKFNVTWATIVGEISHDLNMTNYQGIITLPNVAINTAETVFILNNLAIKLDAKSQDTGYSNNAQLGLKNINFSRGGQDKVTFNDLNMELNLGVDANQQFEIQLTVNVEASQILQQQFAQDKITIQLSNIPAANVPSLALFEALSPRATVALIQQLTNDKNSKLTIELPKHFTEALLTYLSYEIYLNSTLGLTDQRSDTVILRDITTSIKGLIKGAVNQKLFIDTGAYYALNFAS